MTKAPDFESVSTRQQRIAGLAKQSPQMAFTSLNQYLDLSWLHEAYRRTRKDGAVGVDGQTAADYEKDLEGNLRSLLERAKSGTYRAPPVRRTYIPKGTGGDTRPIGIPTLEDKILQRAVVMLIEPIYEQDFHACSYGFRPGRSAHQALQSLWEQTMQSGGGWILEVDIRTFFDTLCHSQTQDGPEPLYAGSHQDCPMVPHPPAPSARRATPDTQPEATRAFCLVWDHGQQHCASPVSAGGAARLVGMAWSSTWREPAHLGQVPAIRAALGAAATDCLAFRVPCAKQRGYLRNRMR